MSRYRALYDRHGLLAEYCNDELVFVRSDAGDGKSSGPQVVRDIDPYKSMITGEMITSRSHHRDHLRQHGCVEVGNDTSHMKTRPEPPKADARKRVLASQFADMSDRQISKLIRAEIKSGH